MRQLLVALQRRLRALKKHVRLGRAHNGKDGRPRAADKRGQCAQAVRQREHSLAALAERQAVLLVQAVLGGHGQKVVPLLAEGRCQQRRAGKIVHGVCVGHHFGQRCPRLFRQQLEIRDPCREGDPGRDGLFQRVDMPLVIGRNHEAAQQRRGHIVRVPLQLGGAQNARRDARAAGAQAPRHGNGVRLHDAQAVERPAAQRVYLLGRAVDQVARRAGHERAVGRRDVHAVKFLKRRRIVQREGKPAGIEARADIRARGRNADFYHTAPPIPPST